MFPILLSLAGMQAAPQPVSSPSSGPQEDIVVIARQLRKVRFSFEAKHGALTRCKIERPSGSAFLNKLVCEAAGECAAEHPDLSSRHLTPCIVDRVKQQAAAHGNLGQPHPISDNELPKS